MSAPRATLQVRTNPLQAGINFCQPVDVSGSVVEPCSVGAAVSLPAAVLVFVLIAWGCTYYRVGRH